MQRRTGSTNWLWLAAAFAVGLLIGWIVLGWWLFPVNWTDANVKDLRQELRYQYLSLVADSYLANGDLGLAGRRRRRIYKPWPRPWPRRWHRVPNRRPCPRPRNHPLDWGACSCC